MDLNAIMNTIAQFFSTDFGAAFGRVLSAIFQFFFPANAPAAHDVPLPTPKIPGK
ncbi:hypothetical protein CAURIC_00830 [Corynebacterium auriscanis]|nr:hypothetical protein CAURIC_00830 [Corynebacterium auriscanis]